MNRKTLALGLGALVLMPILAVAISTVSGLFNIKELPVFGDVPDFTMTERSGKKVSRDSLKGKVWAASFIFTRCSGQCPMLCQELVKVQKKLRFKENFRLVSFSVDPKNDTPQVLTDYANKVEADPYKWLFLTGDHNQMQSLIRHGFRLASAEGRQMAGATEEVIHSFKVVLVDASGRIRGYYDGLDEGEVKNLIRDSRRLIRQAF